MAFPLIIDTDMAFDDWMAVTYLLACPDVNIRALTIAATGEAHASFGVQNALRLLALTQKPWLPVAAGRKRPFRGDHTFPWLVRLVMDYRLGLALPRPTHLPAPQTAVELITHQLRTAAEPVTVIALGPLTDLAEAIMVDAALVKQIARIYIMGGALNVPGNLAELKRHSTNPYAEWNIYIDPYAAATLFQSGAPLTLVPLDVTNQYTFTLEFFQRCATTRSTPTADFIYRLLKRLLPLRRVGTIYFWDPLVAVIAVHPEIAQFEERNLLVIQEEGNECGRIVESPQGNPVQVCVKIDLPTFEQRFLDTLNRNPNTVG